MKLVRNSNMPVSSTVNYNFDVISEAEADRWPNNVDDGSGTMKLRKEGNTELAENADRHFKQFLLSTCLQSRKLAP